MILPQMEQSALYNAVNFSIMWGPTKLGTGATSVLGQQNSTVRVIGHQLADLPVRPQPGDRHDQCRRDRLATSRPGRRTSATSAITA